MIRNKRKNNEYIPPAVNLIFREYLEHILSECPELAQRQYLSRHNDALKHILSARAIETEHVFREGHTNPQEEPRNYYINREKGVKIIWNCIVTTGVRMPVECNKSDLQVINKREEKIDIVKMACLSWRNRAETEERKTRKCRTVRQELKK